MKNLTPHAIVLCDPDDGTEATIPPEPVPARVELEEMLVGHLRVGGSIIPLVRIQTGEVTGLPEPTGEILVVSRAVQAAVPGRTDVLVPGGLIRDEKGRVMAATRLETVHPSVSGGGDRRQEGD